MRRVKIALEETRIEINGKVYTLRKSDGDVWAETGRLLAECRRLDTGDDSAIRTQIAGICAEIDTCLGEGAMLAISGGKPVSIYMALETLCAIAGECARAYAAHVRGSYLEGLK